MAKVKLSALTELAEGPAEGDEVYLRDISEAAADESKRITAVELLNPEQFTALAVSPAASDEIFINDGGVGKKITVDDFMFGDASTPSTQAHGDSAATGSAIEAARVDHKHAMTAFSTAGEAKVTGQVNSGGALQSPDLNVSSVEDTGVGDRTINFTTAFSTAVFHPVGSSDMNAGHIVTGFDTFAAGSVRMMQYTGDSLADRGQFFAIFGDQ